MRVRIFFFNMDHPKYFSDDFPFVLSNHEDQVRKADALKLPRCKAVCSMSCLLGLCF